MKAFWHLNDVLNYVLLKSAAYSEQNCNKVVAVLDWYMICTAFMSGSLRPYFRHVCDQDLNDRDEERNESCKIN